MRIVLAEPLLQAYLPQLEEATGHAHSWQLAESVDADLLESAEVLVSGTLPAALGGAAKRLRLVQSPGAGYEGIALDALPPGVVVANTFHHGRSIAEYVVMVVLALRRQLLSSDRELRAGRWMSPRYVPDMPAPDTLRGQTVGVVGLGEIGAEVVRLLAAFDMRCVAVRRDASRPLPEGVHLDWLGGPERLSQLCAESDLVVVTVPYSAETDGLLGRRELAAMRPSALLVNVARGAVVDEDALYAALAGRRIAGAALDVWWRYPDSSGAGEPATTALAQLDNVVMTPHVSGVTTETFARRIDEIADNINRLAAGEPLHNVIRS